ncbi:HAD family hydrolase [Photobacterium marinum]|nr:HAD-IB family phosphatase [Photobacterium marinum]
MSNDIKVIYLDFCHTAVNKFTLGSFIRYVQLREINLLSIFNDKIRRTEVSERIENLDHKVYDNLDKYGHSYSSLLIKKHINQNVISEIRNLTSNGYKLVVVSAALKYYIKPFFDMLDVNVYHYITSQIEKKGNKLSLDFMYAERKLEEIIKFENQLNIIESVAYSDHITDLPMLKHSNRVVVVEGPNKELLKVAENNNWRIINGH